VPLRTPHRPSRAADWQPTGSCRFRKRSLPLPLVLDADLGLANLDVVLNLFPKITLHDVFTGKHTLPDAILRAPGNFWVLLAGSGMVEYSRMTPEVREQLLKVITEVEPRFDHVLLDTGAGISDVVLCWWWSRPSPLR
jgi:MinD-like ATPase involved in chromosome partitioning or flagellar assembly